MKPETAEYIAQANRFLQRHFPEAQCAFETGFATDDTSRVIALAERLLAPHGGFHFAGYRQTAPVDWRKP